MLNVSSLPLSAGQGSDRVVWGHRGLENITVMSNGDLRLRDFSGRPVKPMSSPLHSSPLSISPHLTDHTGQSVVYRVATDGLVMGVLLLASMAKDSHAPLTEKGDRSFWFYFSSYFICVADIAANSSRFCRTNRYPCRGGVQRKGLLGTRRDRR
jgi:hypothetical protein